MPITRVTNRKRPKNRQNQADRQARNAAQSRWLVHGSTATHEERLGLVDPDEAQTPKVGSEDS